MAWGGCGVMREPAGSCFGSFVSHTEKVPWFLRKGRGRGQGHSTALLTRVVQGGSGGELGPARALEPIWERLAVVVQNLLGRLSGAREGSI